ncbi:MAG TPA: hypothetical protein VE777_21935 [Gaiellales bacterium]|nr:hypothetical protein [Gaiellales bacterium]
MADAYGRVLACGLGAALLGGCSLGHHTKARTGLEEVTQAPVPLRATPSWVRAACGGLPPSIRLHCPSVLPAGADAGLSLSVSLASADVPFTLLQVEAGGEHDGDQRLNRPPRYVGVFLASGNLEQTLPAIFPRSAGAPVPVRDGLANIPRRRALSLGRRRWAGISGRLSLAPSRGRIPYVYFHYLLFRWRASHGETAIGVHAWEPFTETVQTLHALVDRLTPAAPHPLVFPPLPEAPGGVAMTRAPDWLLGACYALDTRPICPTRIPAAQPSLAVFFEPRWRSGPNPSARQDLLSVSWGAPHGSDFARNGPPGFLHLDLIAGAVPVNRRYAHARIPPRDGLMRRTGTGEAAGAPIPLGHPDWGGHHGSLVLGDCFSNHLCFRWAEDHSTYQVDIHGWEPFTQTVAALRRIVGSIPRRG